MVIKINLQVKKITNWKEGDQLAIYKSVEELNFGPRQISPFCGREEDLNPRTLAHTSKPLPIGDVNKV